MNYWNWLIENEPYCLVFEKCYTPCLERTHFFATKEGALDYCKNTTLCAELFYPNRETLTYDYGKPIWTNGKKTELERALEEGRGMQLGL